MNACQVVFAIACCFFYLEDYLQLRNVRAEILG